MTLSMFFRNDLKKLNYMCQLLYKLRERERERQRETERDRERQRQRQRTRERERDGSNYDQKFYEGNFMLFWAYFQIFSYLIIPH